jgi:hypothetical protein
MSPPSHPCKQTLCIMCPLTLPPLPPTLSYGIPHRLQLLAGAAAGLQVAGGLLGLDLGHPGDTLAQLRSLALVRAGLSEEQVRGEQGWVWRCLNECLMMHRRVCVCVTVEDSRGWDKAALSIGPCAVHQSCLWKYVFVAHV